MDTGTPVHFCFVLQEDIPKPVDGYQAKSRVSVKHCMAMHSPHCWWEIWLALDILSFSVCFFGTALECSVRNSQFSSDFSSRRWVSAKPNSTLKSKIFAGKMGRSPEHFPRAAEGQGGGNTAGPVRTPGSREHLQSPGTAPQEPPMGITASGKGWRTPQVSQEIPSVSQPWASHLFLRMGWRISLRGD